MADLNIYNPGFTRDMPVRNRACLFGTLPVSDPLGNAEFNALVLSPGNSAGQEYVGAEQMEDLMQNLLAASNLERFRIKDTGRIFLRAVPTDDWIKYRDHISERFLIIRLPDGYKPSPTEERVMLGLRRNGAQFAISLVETGAIIENEELLKCVDYVLVDSDKYAEQMAIYTELKQKLSGLRNIGVKAFGQDFSPAEARQFDLVLGLVSQDLYDYAGERPLWQHELLRTLAEEFSGIYDVKQIIRLSARYPEMSFAVKSLFGSNKLMALTVRRGGAFASASRPLRYSKTDLVNLLCISTVYGLTCETDKAVRKLNGDDAPYTPNFRSSGFGYFRNALIGARTISRLAADICDDYETNHAFIIGLLRLLPALMRDSREHCDNEFMLTAIADFYKGNGTLGLVVKGYECVTSRDYEGMAQLADRIGMSFPREQFFCDYYEAMVWADTVIGILSGRITD